MGYRLVVIFIGFTCGLDFSVDALVNQCQSLTIGDLYTTNLTLNQYKIGVRDENYARYTWRWRRVGAEEWETFTNTVPYYIIEVKPTKRYEFQCKAGCTNGEEGEWSPKLEFINDCEGFSGSLSYVLLENSVEVDLNASGHFDGYDFYDVKIKDDFLFANRSWGSDEPKFQIPLSTSHPNELKFKLTCPNGQETTYTDWYEIRAYCEAASSRDIVAIPLSASRLQVICQRSSSQYEFRIKELNDNAWRNSGPQITSIYQFDQVNTNLSYEIQCRLACGSWSASALYEGVCQAPEYADLKVEWPAYDKIKITDQGAGDGVTAWEWRWRVLGSNSNWLGVRTTMNNYTMRNLQPRTEYEFRVRRICGQAEGDWLENIYISTSEFPCIPPLDGLDVDEIEFKSADLFTYIEDFERVQFRYRPKSGQQTWVETAETRQPRLRIFGLEYGTRYQFQGRLKCNGEYSDWADGPEFTTRDCFTPDPNHMLVTETTNNSFTVTYLADYDYEIEWRYRLVGNTSWIKPDRNGFNEIFVSGLTSSESYEVQCRLVCGVVNGTNVWSDWVTGPTVTVQGCNPVITNVREITTTSMKIVMPAGYAGYAVRYTIAGTDNWANTNFSPNRRQIINNLLPGTQYEIQSRFNCSGVESAFGNSVFESTLASAAAFRESGPHESYLFAEILDAQRVELSVNVSGFSGYQFRVRMVDDLAWLELPATTEDHTIFPVSWNEECKGCNEYYFQARVLNAGNLTGVNTRSDEWSPWSRESSFSPLRILNQLCPPLEANRLAAAQIDKHGALLVCDLQELSSYLWRIRRSQDSIWTLLPISEVPFLKTDSLSESTEYEFQVAIPCQGQFGLWSKSQYFQTRGNDDCAPPEYHNIYVTRIGSHSAIIGCPLKGAGPIIWRFRPSGALSWNYLPLNNYSLRRLSDLQPATSYEVQARLMCTDSLVSWWSPYVTFMTLPNCPEIAPSQIIVSTVSENSVSISIKDSNAVSYAFRYRLLKDSTWNRLPLSSATEAVLNDLRRNQDYEVQVYTSCATSPGQWSESQYFLLQSTTAFKTVTNEQVTIYPNPSGGQIMVDLSRYSGNWEAQVLSMLGQVIWSKQLTAGAIQSLTLQLSPNVYLLRLIQGQEEKTFKLVIH